MRRSSAVPNWRKRSLHYVEQCSWIEARDHIAQMIRGWVFTDWESMFVATMDGKIIGMASVMKTDYYPPQDIRPWVSRVFVSEAYRSQRISGKMISHAVFSIVSNYKRTGNNFWDPLRRGSLVRFSGNTGTFWPWVIVGAFYALAEETE